METSDHHAPSIPTVDAAASRRGRARRRGTPGSRARHQDPGREHEDPGREPAETPRLHVRIVLVVPVCHETATTEAPTTSPRIVVIERRPRGCREDPRASDGIACTGSGRRSCPRRTARQTLDVDAFPVLDERRDLFARPGAGRREVPAVGGVDWKAAIRIPTTAPSSVPASRTTTSRRTGNAAARSRGPDRVPTVSPRELEERLLQVAFVGLEQRRGRAPSRRGLAPPVHRPMPRPRPAANHRPRSPRCPHPRAPTGPRRDRRPGPSRPIPVRPRGPRGRSRWRPASLARCATRSAICWTSERMWLETVRPLATEAGGGRAPRRPCRIQAVGRLVEDQSEILQQRGRDAGPASSRAVGAHHVACSRRPFDAIERASTAPRSIPSITRRISRLRRPVNRGYRGRRFHDRPILRITPGASGGRRRRTRARPAEAATRTQQTPDRGRLARSVGTEEPEHTSLGDLEVEPVERNGPTAVFLPEALDLDHRGHRATLLRRFLGGHAVATRLLPSRERGRTSMDPNHEILFEPVRIGPRRSGTASTRCPTARGSAPRSRGRRRPTAA